MTPLSEANATYQCLIMHVASRMVTAADHRTMITCRCGAVAPLLGSAWAGWQYCIRYDTHTCPRCTAPSQAGPADA